MKKDVHITSADLPSPKRGAFPTPRAEIESATPYLPESDQADNQSRKEPVPPADAEQNGKSGGKPKEPKQNNSDRTGE
jgi:hypothetical protein